MPTLRTFISATLGVALCQIAQLAVAAGAWDCRPAADGSGWDCRGATAASPRSVAPAAPESAPIRAAADGTPPAPVSPPPPRPERPRVAEPAASPPTAITEPPPRAPTAVAEAVAETPQPVRATQAASAEPAKTAAAAPEPEQAATPAVPSQPSGAAGPATIDVPASLDAGLPWTYCGPPIGVRSDLPAVAAASLADEAIEAEADAAETRVEDEVVTLTGDVRVRHGEEMLRADRADYDRRSEVIDAQGNVLVVRPDIRVSGEAARVEMATDRGEITKAEYRLIGTNARGTADIARFRGKSVSDYENITYTTCRPGRDDWVLDAEGLLIDRDEGVGDAKDATLSLGGVPVAYLPRIVFPIDDRRRSGLLFPTYGVSDSRGFDLRVPYYFNLAPNYDATLVPRVMSKRGVMLEGEFRHLSASSSSRVRGAFLPDDWDEPDLGARWAASVQHRQSWGRLSGDVNYNQVSDDRYLDDFGRNLAQNSARYLTRRAGATYGGDGWSLSALVSDYQSIDPTVNPYRLLPSVGFTGGHAEELAGQTVRLGVGATYTNFDRDSGVVGQRVDLYPYLTVPWRSSWGYAVPKLGLRYTTYSLEDQPATQPDSPDRTLGVASLDGGLFFERDDEWFGSGITQTLEPRFYYVYIPRVDQDDIPIFDTSQYSPIYEAYFLENLFTGPDRVNDANRVSLGVTTRLIPHESGIEALRLSVGQAFFFNDRKVQLPGQSPATSTASPLLGEVGLRFDRHWSAVASGQWDLLGSADTRQYDTSAVRLAYHGDDGRFVRAGYGKTDGVTEYTDLAVTWPVTGQVSLIGRWAYSLETDENMEALAGIEYGSCCWRVRAFARQHLKTASIIGDQLTGEQETSFLVQLELRGLGAVGDDIEELLDRSLHGYLDDTN